MSLLLADSDLKPSLLPPTSANVVFDPHDLLLQDSAEKCSDTCSNGTDIPAHFGSGYLSLAFLPFPSVEMSPLRIFDIHEVEFLFFA